MCGELFGQEEFFEEQKSVKDDTNITTTILYFSEEELKEFKQLCKVGMKKEFTDLQGANIPDLLLTTLRKNYGTNN